MNPWLRLLMLLFVLVGGVFVLRMLPGPIVLVAFGAAVVVVYRILRSTHEREPSGGAAEMLGLRAAPPLPSGLGGYPLALLTRAGGGRQTDVMDGRWGSLDVRVFDHTYAPSVTIDGTPSERTFTCALTRAARGGPRLVVEPEAFLTPAPDRAQLAEVELGMERFDAAFDVRSDDAGFARALLDQDLTSWLLAQGERWGFEVSGDLVLLFAPGAGRDGRREVLDALSELLDQIPSRDAIDARTETSRADGIAPGPLPEPQSPS